MRFLIGLVSGAALILLLAQLVGPVDQLARERLPAWFDGLATRVGDALALPPRPAPDTARALAAAQQAAQAAASSPVAPAAREKSAAKERSAANHEPGVKPAPAVPTQPDATVAAAGPEPASRPIPRPPDPLPVDSAAADRSAADRSAADRSAADRSAADKRAADERAADERAADEKAADEGAADAEDAQQLVRSLFDAPLERVAGRVEDPSTRSSQPVWVPFHSRMSASGFAERLSESLDYPFQVERRGPGRYQVVFAYHDEPQRQAVLAEAAALTGLPL